MLYRDATELDASWQVWSGVVKLGVATLVAVLARGIGSRCDLNSEVHNLAVALQDTCDTLIGAARHFQLS